MNAGVRIVTVSWVDFQGSHLVYRGNIESGVEQYSMEIVKSW